MPVWPKLGGRRYYPTRAELMAAGFVVLMEGRGVVVMGVGEPVAADRATPVADQ